MDKQKNLDELFRHAKEQNPVVTFSETKERFLSSNQTNNLSSNTQKSSFLLTKKLIIMIVAISTILISLFLTNSKVENKTTLTHSSKIKKETKNNIETIENGGIKSIIVPSKLVVLPSSFKQLFTEENILFIESIDSSESQQYVSLLKDPAPKFKEEYVFPKLTEEEIKANHKQKKQMLKDLEKFDKKVYAYIPSGTFDYQGKQVSVQSFYMQKTEVSNLEYRTFLFDLLIKGRKDEFLIAKPDQKQWSLMANKGKIPYEENYFSHPAYDLFPVVNVGREGAEMYCKWLTQELVKNVGADNQNKYNDIRIPLRVEWVKAASVEGKQLPYPWDGNSIRNMDSLVLANCVLGYSNDTLRYNWNPNTDIIDPVKSYWPNEYGIYNLAGNASEMVYEGINQESPGTIGGNWKTFYEGVKILAPDEYQGVVSPKPTIGFRVVMTVKKQ